MKIIYKAHPVINSNLVGHNINFSNDALTIWDTANTDENQNVSYQISPSGVETKMRFMHTFWTLRVWSISIAHK